MVTLREKVCPTPTVLGDERIEILTVPAERTPWKRLKSRLERTMKKKPTIGTGFLDKIPFTSRLLWQHLRAFAEAGPEEREIENGHTTILVEVGPAIEARL